MNKLDELYQIATGTPREGSLHSEFIKRNSKVNIEKARAESSFYKNMYSDPRQQFNNWFDKTEKYVDENNKNEYWEVAKTFFPGSENGAKTYLKTYVDSLSSGDSYEEEITLRNLVSKLPDWAAGDVQQRLMFLQTQNSNQNLMKAVNLYKTNLKDRMQKLMLEDLDLDVPEDEHLKDFLKLESMNLLDAARVANGRLVTMNDKGTIVPAFGVQDRADVFKDNLENPSLSEMDIVYKTAPDIFRDFIKGNISKGKQKVALGNKVASSAARKMLESGDLPVEGWSEVFGIITQDGPETVLNSGLSGLIKKNPYMTQDEVIANVTKASRLYPDIFKEADLRRTNVSVPTNAEG